MMDGPGRSSKRLRPRERNAIDAARLSSLLGKRLMLAGNAVANFNDMEGEKK
jgi:hypothetical protein